MVTGTTTLTVLQEMILDILRETPNQTAEAIAEKLEATIDRINNQLETLEIEGLASCHIASGICYWLPTEKALEMFSD